MHRIRATIIFLVYAALPHFTSAQVEFNADQLFFLRDVDRMMVDFWSEAELLTVDTTRLRITYSMEYKQTSNSDTYFNMLTVVQVGTTCTKYYSMRRQFIDDIAIDDAKHAKQLAPLPEAGIRHSYTEREKIIDAIAGEDRMNSEIWIDNLNEKLTERSHTYVVKNSSIEYNEPCQVFEWEHQSQTDTIAGYPCFTATTTFRGRAWTVWYTTDISVDAGPWKFCGLPGLILQAKDATGDYYWTCRELRQTGEPIVYYKVRSNFVSRDQWRKYMLRIHEAPVATMGGNSSVAFYYVGEDSIQQLDDDWTIPYNPIELE